MKPIESTYGYKVGSSLRRWLGLTSKPTKLSKAVSVEYFARYWYWRALIADLVAAVLLIVFFALPFHFLGIGNGLMGLFCGIGLGGGIGGYVILSVFIRIFNPLAMPGTPAFPWTIAMESDRVDVFTKPNRTAFTFAQIVRCQWYVDDNWDQINGIEGSFLRIELNNGAVLKIPESSKNFDALREALKEKIHYEHILV